jgi:hypothetical protein
VFSKSEINQINIETSSQINQKGILPKSKESINYQISLLIFQSKKRKERKINEPKEMAIGFPAMKLIESKKRKVPVEVGPTTK